MLKIKLTDHASIRRHGEEAYPHECCGVLLGRVTDDGTRIVTSTARCANTVSTRPTIVTTLTPAIWSASSARVANAARTSSAFTTPPRPSCRWSPTDLAEAHWFGCSYVITSVEKGRAVLTNSFELTGNDESDKQLSDETIEIS